MTKITVLTGGSTAERDVALAGAAQVVSALREGGYQVTVVDTVTGVLSAAAEERLLVPSVGTAPPTLAELELLAASESLHELVDLPAVAEADLVFIVLHGRQGEGGFVQAILESAGIPYAGSDPIGSALAMDKDVAKRLLRDAGVPTPNWLMWPAGDEDIRRLGLPLVVKPSRAGSSVGLTVVRELQDLTPAVELALAYDDEVMIEEFLEGREFTVGVLGDEALAVGEIIPQHAIFDYECKYTPGMTQEIFPADLPAVETARIRESALRAHRALKLRDFSRVDFRWDTDRVPRSLELNTIPGMTATSLLPQSAAALGIDFRELCHRICQLALRRTRTRNKVRLSVSKLS